MRRLQNGGFDRPFADIWQFSPFQPNHGVADFINQFNKAGHFDADGFWEFVTTGAKRNQLKKQPGRDCLPSRFGGYTEYR